MPRLVFFEKLGPPAKVTSIFFSNVRSTFDPLEVPDDPAQKPFAFPCRPLFLRFTVLPGTLLGVFPNFRVFRRDGRRDLSQRVALRDADTHGRPSRKDGADRYEGNEGDSAQHALYRYWSSTS